MKMTRIALAVALSILILLPSTAAAFVANALPGVAAGGFGAAKERPLQAVPWEAGAEPCAGSALEIPDAGADTSAVQYKAGIAGCGAPGDAAPAGWPGPAGRAGLAAVAYAEAQIGTPYQWGGERAGVGFDCSGLAQAAWRAAGVALPRVALAQFDQGPELPVGEALEPGDLVFFGHGATDVTHVGIVVDASGLMVDAPHTGALVRIDPFPIIPGGRWGGEVFVGATRPGGAT